MVNLFLPIAVPRFALSEALPLCLYMFRTALFSWWKEPFIVFCSNTLAVCLLVTGQNVDGRLLFLSPRDSGRSWAPPLLLGQESGEAERWQPVQMPRCLYTVFSNFQKPECYETFSSFPNVINALCEDVQRASLSCVFIQVSPKHRAGPWTNWLPQ